MDEQRKQLMKRVFYEQPVWVKWSHISAFLAYKPGLFSSVPTRITADGRERSIAQDFGPVMNAVLTIMVQHMDGQTATGQTVEEKDIAQTFWGSLSYVAEETGFSRNAISAALLSLVDAGILIKEGERGKMQFYALSERTIEAITGYSKAREAKFRAANPENKPIRRVKKTVPTVENDCPDSRVWLSRQSGLTVPTVGFDCPDSRVLPLIEEGLKDSRTEPQTDPQMDGCKGVVAGAPPPSQPSKGEDGVLASRNYGAYIGLCKKIEWQISEQGKGYAEWEETQLFLAECFDSHGERAVKLFAKWLEPFMRNRIKAGKLFKKQATWEAKLRFCWDCYLESLKSEDAGTAMLQGVR